MGGAVRRALVGAGLVAGLAGLGASLVVASGPPATASRTGASRKGHGQPSRRRGTLTVLEDFLSWSTGLDPMTSPRAGADQSVEDAIFGELFQLGPHGKTVPDLAAGYRLGTGARSLTIDLRHAVRFSDGTAFDAKAVAFNLRHDLKAACACRPPWPGATITTSGRYVVTIHLKRPDGAVLDQFQDSNVNWIASPSALHREGAQGFAERPVGAGPFEVVSNTTDQKLVLKANPSYFEKGHPYLKGLVFLRVNGDEPALEDLRSGAAQAYESLTTPALLGGFTSAHLTATLEPSTSVVDLALNVSAAPFRAKRARRALYLATDTKALDKALNGGAVGPSESFTGPTGRFYEPRVPGYPTYDLRAAKRLVKRLGGLRFTLVVASYLAQGIGTALQGMFEQAGMKVTLTSNLRQGWGAALGALGSFDPAEPTSGLSRFPPSGPIGRALAAGEAAATTAARAKDYAKAAGLFAKDELGPFLYPPAEWSIAAPGVRGPGLTTELPAVGPGPAVWWQDVSMRSGSSAHRAAGGR